jgi:hypothetical protein
VGTFYVEVAASDASAKRTFRVRVTPRAV